MSRHVTETKKRERLAFEEAWRDAESVNQVLALYHSQPVFMYGETAKIVDKFRRYIWKFKHVEIEQFLAIDEFRPAIVKASRSIWSDLLPSIPDAKSKARTAAKDEKIISTFHVILKDLMFRYQMTDLWFLMALRKQLPVSIIDEMIRIASEDSSAFRISPRTLAGYKEQSQNIMSEPYVIRTVALVQETIDIRTAQLNSEGKYVNQDIITCAEGDCKGNGLFFCTPFLNADYGDGEDPYTTIELDCMALSWTIRLKPHWHEKCCDITILAKWRAEVQDQGENMQLFELALQHVQLLAGIGRDENYEVSPVDHVYSSDSIIPSEMLLAFRHEASTLEGVIPVDYHPGSEQQVVDIVHPSLYPLIAGCSRVLKRPVLTLEASWKQNLGNLGLPILSSFDSLHTRNPYGDVALSKKFQWLPAEFHVAADGSVQINSYINNLHPERHQRIYPLLAMIFGQCLPLLEQVLSDNIVKPNQQLRLLTNPHSHDMYDSFEESEGESSAEEEDDEDAYEAYYENRVPLAIPLPETFPVENMTHYLQKKVSLRDKRLQVIVKLATIELTPEKPRYKGGVWHVEGMKNEQIVCTLIHYYSMENITESCLNFRHAISEPDYEQGDDRGVVYRYGLEDEQPLNQELGHVVAKEGRSIAFPNLYQHSVEPFELEDKTRPGHRKILVYFLVDPFQRVLSTADVPPQQRSWVSHQYDSPLHAILGVVGIPEDVIAYLFEFLDYPLSRADAEDIRAKLMEERSRYVDEVTEQVFERPFSLCEH